MAHLVFHHADIPPLNTLTVISAAISRDFHYYLIGDREVAAFSIPGTNLERFVPA